MPYKYNALTGSFDYFEPSGTFSSISSLDYIDFDLTADPAGAEGRLSWNPTDGTLDVGMPGGNVNLQIGQEMLILVRNNSGSVISNGKVVYVTGSLGNKLTVDLADNTDADTIHLLGLATEDIGNNSNGFVAIAGTVRGDTLQPINTSTYPEGTKLYLSTNGDWTNLHPVAATSAVIIIGTVRRQHASLGEIVIGFDYFTIGNNFNGVIRQSVINKNTGVDSAASFTVVNDAGHRVSLTMFGSNYAAGPEVAGLYNEGYNATFFITDGNKSFGWFTDPTDSHNFSSLTNQVMELSADGDLSLLGGHYKLNPTPSNLTGSGTIASVTVDANATGVGALLYVASDGNYEEADASAVGTMPCSAMALETLTGTKKVLFQGYMRDNTWTWTRGGILYASTTTGEMTQTAPSGSGDQVQIVGIATGITTIYFNPNLSLIEVA